MLPHTPEVDKAVEPDCTKPGLTEGSHCSVCDTVIVAQKTVKELGHDKVSHEAKAPTCTEAGHNAYETCSRCDYTTYEEIDELGHDIVHHEGKEPTETEKGWKEYETCSRCEDHNTYEEIPALGKPDDPNGDMNVEDAPGGDYNPPQFPDPII